MAVRQLAKRALAAAARTRPGRSLIHAAVMPDPSSLSLDGVRQWPARLAGFEDLTFLFTSGQLNHGVASLALDEAGYLYREVRSLGPATLVEIGRFRGGSTLVLAAGMDAEAWLYSYDLMPPDGGLIRALDRYGLRDRVDLRVGDSRTAPEPPEPCDLVFVDGDHTYEGVRADYERWRQLVRPGGSLLFHDAADRGAYGSFDEPVARLVSEIVHEDGSEWIAAGGVGSIVHFRRT